MQENDRQATQAFGSQEDKVWISREEYERLRAIDHQIDQVQPGRIISMQEVDESPKENNTWLIALMGVLGVLTLLAFTTHAFSYLAPMLIVALFITGGVTVARALRVKTAPTHSGNTNGGQKVALTLLVVIGVCLAAPQLLMVALFIVMLPFMMLMTGGRGS